MNETLKKHIISYLVTFISMFFTLLGAELVYHVPAEWTATAVSALVVAAIRGAFKATFELIATPKKDNLPEWIDRG